MGMYSAASDQDYDEEMLLTSNRRDAQQPVRCTEPGCNWTVWGEAAKVPAPKCVRHQPDEMKQASWCGNTGWPFEEISLMSPIVAPVAEPSRVEVAERRRVAHAVQLGAGITKAADMLLPALDDCARSKENAVILARAVALNVLSYRSPGMTIDEAVSTLMEMESRS